MGLALLGFVELNKMKTFVQCVGVKFESADWNWHGYCE